jgi:hypothetical protein
VATAEVAEVEEQQMETETKPAKRATRKKETK